MLIHLIPIVLVLCHRLSAHLKKKNKTEHNDWLGREMNRLHG